MTRGRKKDLTIPPSRALTQQRDYRARKAQYVAELEDRCRRAEDENAELRKELEHVKSGLPFASMNNPETIQASSELLHQLGAVSVSLHRFQELATSSTSSHTSSSSLRTFQPSQALPSPTASSSSVSSPPPTYQHTLPDKRMRIESFLVESEPPRSPHIRPPSSDSPASFRRGSSTSSSSFDDTRSQCCDGYFDHDRGHRDDTVAPSDRQSHSRDGGRYYQKRDHAAMDREWRPRSRTSDVRFGPETHPEPRTWDEHTERRLPPP